MSKAYRIAKKENNGKDLSKEKFRKFLQKPGKINPDGSPCYFTEQAHRDTCQVSQIITKYDRTGILHHVNKIEAKYGDLSGDDFKTMADKVHDARKSFEELPSSIRKYFDNSPEHLLRFMENPGNRDKAIELGLIKGSWTPESDGLGEHITDESQRQAITPEPVKEQDT